MKHLQLFLQFEGDRRIELVETSPDAKLGELIVAAARAGLPDAHRQGAAVFSLHRDEPLPSDATLRASGIADKDRVHVHRCRQIEVTIHFNEITKRRRFPPSATVERVKRRFVKNIGMSPVDATEHVLQLCASTDRPEPDLQIGALVSGACALCFDFVPVKRVEG
jgi:hypothetical protein